MQKVYVDGKEFFGTDPKLATKNLTADMVESVQVFDDMSDQAKFTKIDDGSRQKAMNIKLKKDKKNGYFGKINVGGGTDNRYDNNLSFNKFKGNRQVSLIGAVNNTNKQGFSFSDIISTMGGFGNGGPGGGGGGLGQAAVARVAVLAAVAARVAASGKWLLRVVALQAWVLVALPMALHPVSLADLTTAIAGAAKLM